MASSQNAICGVAGEVEDYYGIILQQLALVDQSFSISLKVM